MRFHVHPCERMSGEVFPGGYKHSALAILSASLLAGEPVELEGVPGTSDVGVICQAIRYLGGTVEQDGSTVTIDPSGIHRTDVPDDLARQLRAIYLFIPSLLARFGSFAVARPGGDRIGDRTLEFGLQVAREMGAEAVNDSVMTGKAKRLVGTQLSIGNTNDAPSITKIALIAGSLARGTTVVENAFRSPEIVDLANFVNAMGGDVSGAGTDTLVILGQDKLHGTRFRVASDPLEASTFIAGCAMVGGTLTVRGVSPGMMPADLDLFTRAGLRLSTGSDHITVHAEKPLRAVDFSCGGFPGLNTDAAPPLVGMAALLEGESHYRETVWEGRWSYVHELCKLGADITVEGRELTIRGVPGFRAGTVTAGDLRAAATLILAGLASDGVTTVEDAHLAYRGYEHFDRKLRMLGARIDVEVET